MKKKQKQSKMSILVSLAIIGMLAECQATSSETSQSAESSTTSDSNASASTVDYDLEFSSDDLEVGYEEADLTTIKLADDQSTTSGE